MPIIGIVIGVVLAGAVVLLLLGLLALTIYGTRKKDRGLQLLGGIPFVLMVSSIAFLQFRNHLLTPNQQASWYLVLPTEAQVSNVLYSDGTTEDEGNATITFRLPNTRSPEQWLDAVGKANPNWREIQSQRRQYGRLFAETPTGNHDRHWVAYDSATHLYSDHSHYVEDVPFNEQ